MKKYIATEFLEAKPMTSGEYYQYRDGGIPVDVNPNMEGYRVAYSDGYETWMSKEYFEKITRPTEGMTFGAAIEALKQGKKVARAGWNGKGMYLWLLPAAEVKREWCRDERLIECFGDNDTLFCLGSIRMYTHDSNGRTAVLTGWLASQSDMLCEDWYIVEEASGND